MREIVIIDDSPDDSELLRRTLIRVGVLNPIRIFSIGESAMRYLNTSTLSNAPSVLFIDLRLPGVSGFDILQQTQKTPALAKTFKLAISSLHDIHSIKRAYVLGAETFVTKPIHEADLRELVRSYCDYWIFAAKNATTTPSPPPQVLN